MELVEGDYWVVTKYILKNPCAIAFGKSAKHLTVKVIHSKVEDIGVSQHCRTHIIASSPRKA